MTKDFIAKQRLLALYVRLGQIALTEIRNLAFGLEEIDADFVATIVRKGLHEHRV